MNLARLFSSKKTVFKLEEIGEILNINNKNYLRVLVNRMKKRGEIKMIYKGLYVLNEDYDEWELANKIKSPSYVSFQTVLFKNGVIYQDFSSVITAASNNSYIYKIDGKTYRYHKIKDEILTNPLGIIVEKQKTYASKERAITDMIYLYQRFNFDNLNQINKKLLLKLKEIYPPYVKNEVKKICLTK
jgi:predicted transcriptional regulator of viral defense system